MRRLCIVVFVLIALAFLIEAVSHAQAPPLVLIPKATVTGPVVPCLLNCTSILYAWDYVNPPPGYVDCGPHWKVSCFKGFQLTIVLNGNQAWTFGTGKLGQGALSYHFVPGKELLNGNYVASLMAVALDQNGNTVMSSPAVLDTLYKGKQ